MSIDQKEVLDLRRKLGNAREVARRLNIHYNTVYAISRKSKNLCVRCHAPIHIGRTMCQTCLDWDRTRMRDQRRKRRKQGVCIECGEPRVEGNRNFCEKHRNSAMKRNERYWSKRKGIQDPDQRRRTILELYGEAGLLAWQRDRASCQICRTKHGGGMGKEAVHIHHIDEDQTNNALDNFACLCFRCHRAVHELLAGKDRKALIAWFEKFYPDRPLR